MALNYAHLAPDHLAKAVDKLGKFAAERKTIGRAIAL